MRFIYTKAFAIFAACVCAVALLLFLQLKGWLDPVRAAILRAPRPVSRLAKAAAVPVKDFFTTIYQLKKISEENAQLQARIAALEADVVNENQLAVENQALRNELGFVKSSKLTLVPCTALSQNPFGLSDSLILNCGTNDGVSQGQAVISQGYLVGKITYAGNKTSTVLLADSSEFSTDAKVSQTLASGLVKGSFGSGLILDQVPQTSDLQTGWLVTTAGINSQIPKNLLIGSINGLLSASSDLFKKASVLSPIDFKNLEFVFVVKQ